MRAVKYFLFITVLFALIIGILIAAGFVSTDIEHIFKQGWNSVMIILLMFAAVSAIYPMFGYMKMNVSAGGEFSELRDDIVSFMDSRHYVLEKEEGENLTFRSSRVSDKILKMWEDRITLTRQLGGFCMEGLRRDVVRLRYGLEDKLRGNVPEENE